MTIILTNMTMQFDLFTGQQLRDKGIQSAIDHANAVSANWSENAYAFLVVFVSKHSGEFLAEDVRSASTGIVPSPPSERSWGGVITRAAKSGLITKKGFRSVKNPKCHATPATVWQRIK